MMKIYRIAQEIIPYDPNGLDDDMDWQTIGEEADLVFVLSGIRPDRTKDLSHIQMLDGKVIGGIYSNISQDFIDNQEVWIYSFDIAIHPDFRGGKGLSRQNLNLTRQLIEAALSEWEMYKSEHNVFIQVYVINKGMANLLERDYGFTVEDQVSDTKTMTKGRDEALNGENI
jgi:ribosomal protein S18 acetylase RimI-like enzyme